MFNERPFVYNKNKNVPKIEPFGTPYIILMSEDVYLYCVKFLRPSWVTSSNCERVDKLDLNNKFISITIIIQSNTTKYHVRPSNTEVTIRSMRRHVSVVGRPSSGLLELNYVNCNATIFKRF
jgi:hypothetical protein